MFPCPNCAEKTITLVEKMKAGGWSRRRCPKCGALLAPSVFGLVFASAVGALGFLPPVMLLSPFLDDFTWLVLGFSTLFAFLIGVVVYLFATPLIALGSSTARYDRVGYIVFVAGLILIALVDGYLFR